MNIVTGNGGYSRILLTKEDALSVCKMGQGADCCACLCVGADGFECLYRRLPASYEERVRAGETTAQRLECDQVKKLIRGELKP